MATSYIFAKEPLKSSCEKPRRVAVTGAAGDIGSSFAEYAGERYEMKLLVHRKKNRNRVDKYGIVETGDLTDYETALNICRGMDTVVHLAADRSAKAEWESLHPKNIIAVYNMFRAAVETGCRRIIFASSIHAVSGYPAGYQIHEEDPVNPGDLYGVTKCFGEALARLTAEQEGVSAIALRIGAFQSRIKAEHEDRIGMMNAFVSKRDLNQLICRCIDDEYIQFAIFHALSDNLFNRMDITGARELVDYDPDDDFTELNREVADIHMREQVAPHDTGHKQGSAL